MMSEEPQPTNAELLQAIVALHACTEAGLQRLDTRIDRLDAKLETKVGQLDAKFDAKFGGLDTKIDILRFDMNKRFDRVCDDLDELKMRVTRLEHNRT